MKKSYIVAAAAVGLFALSRCGGSDAPDPGTVVATAVPAADTAEAPAATDAPPARPKIGDVVDIGDGATLTVEETHEDADGNLIVVATIDNTAGTGELAISSLISFEVRDDAGNKGQVALPLGESTSGLDGKVLPGDKLRGHVAYQPGLGAGLTLRFTASLLGDPIVIDLGQ